MDNNKKKPEATVAASTEPSVNELEIVKAENAVLQEQVSALQKELEEQQAIAKAYQDVIAEQTEEIEALKSTPKLPGEDSTPSFEFQGTTYRVVHAVSARINGANLVKVSPAGIADNKALRERLVISKSSAVVKA